MFARFFRGFALGCLILPASAAQASAGGCAATAAEVDDTDAYTLRSTVEEVLLQASVLDNTNARVPELSSEAFQVYEDGEPQVICSVLRLQVPLSLGILIDSSDSMRQKSAQVRSVLGSVLEGNTGADEAFVARFAYDYSLAQEFTSDLTLVRAAIERGQVRGGTALYDAVAESAAYLTAHARHGRRVLLVITDGADVHSRWSLEDVRQRLASAEAPVIFVVGLLGEASRPARRELEALAAESGGKAFFPRSEQQAAAVSRRLAHVMREQYLIAYRPNRRRIDGAYHAVTVEANARGSRRLEVRTRAGYLADGPAGPR